MGMTVSIVIAVIQQLETFRGGNTTDPLHLLAQRVTLVKASGKQQ